MHKKQEPMSRLDIRFKTKTINQLQQIADEKSAKSGKKIKKGEIARKIIENFINSQEII